MGGYTTKQQRKYGKNYEKQEKRDDKKNKIFNIRELFYTKKLEYIIENINSYIEEYGTDCFIIHEYGKYYLELNEIEKAKEKFMINIKNNSINVGYSMYELGKIAIYEKDYETAKKYFLEIIASKHEEKCYAMLELARVYMLEDDLDNAKNLYLDILNNNYSNKTHAILGLYDLNKRKCLYEEALDYLSLLDKNSYIYKYLLADANKNLKNYPLAKQLYEEIIAEGGIYCNDAKHELSIIAYKEGDIKKSLELINDVHDSVNFNEKKRLYLDNLVTHINLNIKLKNIEEALKQIEELQNLTDDRNDDIYFFLGKIANFNNEFDKAITYFEKINPKEKKLYSSSKLIEIFIYIKINNFKKAYEALCLKKEFDIVKLDFLTTLEIYLRKKLNLEISIKPNNYISENILNYDKENVLKHIEKHKYKDESKNVHTIFNENINIEALYDFAYFNINEENYLKNEFLDIYVIPFPNVGYSDTDIYNYIQVITLPNSKEIISIYPIDPDKDLYDINLDMNDYEEKKEKTKKISQIDKFNKKYNL